MPTVREQLDIPKDFAQALGRETLRILLEKGYKAPSGLRVDLSESIERARQSTITYTPVDVFRPYAGGRYETQVDVRNQTTLAAAQELIDDGLNTAALNFASATHPGGGFLSGSRAQEEYLCRSSTLYESIRHSVMYQDQTHRMNPFYDHYVIYSPDVLVIRNDDHQLLDEPYPVSILTSPAVQAKAVARYMPDKAYMIEPVMRERVWKVLAVAHRHGVDGLVLGAWGCGAFGNDPQMVAGLFREALMVDFRGTFARVIFAVTDWSPEEKFIGPFYKVFGGK